VHTFREEVDKTEEEHPKFHFFIDDREVFYKHEYMKIYKYLTDSWIDEEEKQTTTTTENTFEEQ